MVKDIFLIDGNFKVTDSRFSPNLKKKHKMKIQGTSSSKY